MVGLLTLVSSFVQLEVDKLWRQQEGVVDPALLVVGVVIDPGSLCERPQALGVVHVEGHGGCVVSRCLLICAVICGGGGVGHALSACCGGGGGLAPVCLQHGAA